MISIQPLNRVAVGDCDCCRQCSELFDGHCLVILIRLFTFRKQSAVLLLLLAVFHFHMLGVKGEQSYNLFAFIEISASYGTR